MTTACTDCLIPFTSGIYTGLSGLSCLFFMIGAIGYTTTKDTMHNIPWLYSTYSGFDDKSYFSLKAQYDDFDVNGGLYKYSTYADYYNWAEKCESDGHGAYILTIIACLSSLTCTILCGLLIKKADFTFAHFLAAAIAAVSTLMAGIALSMFMGDCQSKVKKFYSGDDPNFVYPDYHWGSGSILTAAGMCFMFIVSLGMFLSAKYGGPAAAKADNSSAPMAGMTNISA